LEIANFNKLSKRLFVSILILIIFFVLLLNADYLRPLGRFLIRIFDINSGDKEIINNLKLENAVLKSQLLELKEIKKENDFLRSFLELQNRKEFNYVLADVIFHSPFNFSQTFTINKGQEDGVRQGDIVIWTGRVLLGKIKKSEAKSALVQTLFDKSFKINVLIGEKNIGLAKGDESKIIIDLIAKDDKINIGDIVQTSALSEQYPKGLIIGEVGNIIEEPQELFKKAELKVPYDWMDVERVMVLQNKF